MADPKFDQAAHAAQAQQLTELATRARTALRADTVERTSRLGQERDDAARRAYGAEQEAAATGQQVKRELAAAEKFDDAAAKFERQAADMEQRGVDRGTAEMAADLREQAAEQRALAEVARNRAHDASADGDRLRQEAIDQRAKTQQLEADLAAEPKRREQLEEAVDNLEFNASEAAYSADLSRRAAELDARAEAAATRGDRSGADTARAQATKMREEVITRGENREILSPELDQLGRLGITVPSGLLTPPGFAAVSMLTEPPEAPAAASDDVITGTVDAGGGEQPGGEQPGIAGDIDVVTGQVDDQSGGETGGDTDADVAADVFIEAGELVGADTGVAASDLSSQVMAELFDGVTGEGSSGPEFEPFDAAAAPAAEAASDFAADSFDAPASSDVVAAGFDSSADFAEG
jgi:hypothetical protein